MASGMEMVSFEKYIVRKMRSLLVSLIRCVKGRWMMMYLIQ